MRFHRARHHRARSPSDNATALTSPHLDASLKTAFGRPLASPVGQKLASSHDASPPPPAPTDSLDDQRIFPEREAVRIGRVTQPRAGS